MAGLAVMMKGSFPLPTAEAVLPSDSLECDSYHKFGSSKTRDGEETAAESAGEEERGEWDRCPQQDLAQQQQQQQQQQQPWQQQPYLSTESKWDDGALSTGYIPPEALSSSFLKRFAEQTPGGEEAAGRLPEAELRLKVAEEIQRILARSQLSADRSVLMMTTALQLDAPRLARQFLAELQDQSQQQGSGRAKQRSRASAGITSSSSSSSSAFITGDENYITLSEPQIKAIKAKGKAKDAKIKKTKDATKKSASGVVSSSTKRKEGGSNSSSSATLKKTTAAPAASGKKSSGGNSKKKSGRMDPAEEDALFSKAVEEVERIRTRMIRVASVNLDETKRNALWQQTSVMQSSFPQTASNTSSIVVGLDDNESCCGEAIDDNDDDDDNGEENEEEMGGGGAEESVLGEDSQLLLQIPSEGSCLLVHGPHETGEEEDGAEMEDSEAMEPSPQFQASVRYVLTASGLFPIDSNMVTQELVVPPGNDLVLESVNLTDTLLSKAISAPAAASNITSERSIFSSRSNGLTGAGSAAPISAQAGAPAIPSAAAAASIDSQDNWRSSRELSDSISQLTMDSFPSVNSVQSLSLGQVSQGDQHLFASSLQRRAHQLIATPLTSWIELNKQTGPSPTKVKPPILSSAPSLAGRFEATKESEQSDDFLSYFVDLPMRRPAPALESNTPTVQSNAPLGGGVSVDSRAGDRSRPNRDLRSALDALGSHFSPAYGKPAHAAPARPSIPRLADSLEILSSLQSQSLLQSPSQSEKLARPGRRVSMNDSDWEQPRSRRGSFGQHAASNILGGSSIDSVGDAGSGPFRQNTPRLLASTSLKEFSPRHFQEDVQSNKGVSPRGVNRLPAQSTAAPSVVQAAPSLPSLQAQKALLAAANAGDALGRLIGDMIQAKKKAEAESRP